MQKKYFFCVNLIFLRKKGDFSDVFSAFYSQPSVTAAWTTRSPWSIKEENSELVTDKSRDRSTQSHIAAKNLINFNVLQTKFPWTKFPWWEKLSTP